MIRKSIVAGTVALTLAGAGFALAQPAPREGAGMRPTAEDVAAFTDARIAGLKAGLKLTAEQEKNWPAVEAALRDLSKERADRMKQRADRREARRNGAAEPARPDTIARLRQGADAMTARAAGLKKLADASEPLYKSLDEAQKRRFTVLLRTGATRQAAIHHRAHWQHRADSAR